MRKRKLISKKFIFISIILSMSMIGGSYASWEDNNNIKLSIKTGFINPVFYVENKKIAFGDEKLILTPTNDGRTLYIEGNVYPSFNNDILVKIIDEGSIPSVFSYLYEDDDNIATLTGLTNNKQRSSLNINNDYIESFEINVNPDSDNFMSEQSDTNIDFNDGISKLEYEIETLKEKIHMYDREENYEFEYILSFKQGL